MNNTKRESKHYQINKHEARCLVEALDYYNAHSLDAGPTLPGYKGADCKNLLNLLKKQVLEAYGE